MPADTTTTGAASADTQTGAGTISGAATGASSTAALPGTASEPKSPAPEVTENLLMRVKSVIKAIAWFFGHDEAELTAWLKAHL
jgi:hypothetical protein